MPMILLPAGNSPLPFPPELLAYVNAQRWTFAKTTLKWPHEYIVRDRDDQRLFEQLARHIRTHGYEGRFYRKPIIYYDEGGFVY